MVISKLINIWMGWDTCSRHLVSNSKRLMHCENGSESRIWLFAAPRTHSLWASPGPSTGGGGLSLLQGIFPTQGSNPGLPHYRRILYQLNHQGSPLIHWVHCQRARLCAWFVREVWVHKYILSFQQSTDISLTSAIQPVWSEACKHLTNWQGLWTQRGHAILNLHHPALPSAPGEA